MELKPSKPILLRYESFFRIQGINNIATTFGGKRIHFVDSISHIF